jgi:DNA repair exonuclease SbcCD nuclease subunit
MKLLAAADLHLGRALGSVPKSLATEYSPKIAWEQLVEMAVSQSVDGLLLAGDVVDSQGSYFEAWGPLQRGLTQLAEAGISVVAVAGNHDTSVLPALVDDLAADNVILLGRGGNWEFYDLVSRDGDETARIYGWSFPQSHYNRSPFALPWPDESDIPSLRIGLLHADYGQSGSDYAPVPGSAFPPTDVPVWILGHIHVPSLHQPATGTEVIYPGSLQNLDAGETGWHGCVRIDSAAGGALTWSRVPVGTFAFLNLALDAATFDCSEGGLFEALRDEVTAQIKDAETVVKAVSVDLHIDGESKSSSADYQKLLENMGDHDEDLLDCNQFGLRLRKCRVSVRLPEKELNLVELARGDDFIGMLAKALLDVKQNEAADNPVAQEILQKVSDATLRVAGGRNFGALPSPDERDAADLARDTFLELGYELLRKLVAEARTPDGHDDE